MRSCVPGITGISTMTSAMCPRAMSILSSASRMAASPSSTFTLKRISSSPRSAKSAHVRSSSPKPDV